jgi:hypothetical protein
MTQEFLGYIAQNPLRDDIQIAKINGWCGELCFATLATSKSTCAHLWCSRQIWGSNVGEYPPVPLLYGSATELFEAEAEFCKSLGVVFKKVYVEVDSARS